jgi:hypothetical protein
MSPLSLRTLSEIFTEISSGRPLLYPLVVSPSLPSYLFALKSIKSGPIALLYSLEDPVRLKLWAELQKDALYLFKNGKKREGYPLFCIPLKKLMVILNDQGLIELRPGDAQQMIFVSYTCGEGSSVPMLIKEITLHACLYLNVTLAVDRKLVDQIFYEWYDAIENQVWE